MQLTNPLANITKLNKIDQISALKIVQEKTKIKPSQIAVLIVLGVILFCASYFVKISRIFIWFFCYFFPAYFTLIALRDGNSKVFMKYLVYWVCYPLVLQFQPLIKMFFNKTIFNLFRVLWTALFLSPHIDLSSKFFETVLKPFL